MPATKKSASNPDNTIDFPDGSVAKHMGVGDHTVTEIKCKPGWSWSKHVKPRVDTEQCEKVHVGYMVSGRLACKMTGEDEVVEFGPGDAFHIPPGHDGWVVGNQEAVMVEYTPKDVTPYAMKK